MKSEPTGGPFAEPIEAALERELRRKADPLPAPRRTPGVSPRLWLGLLWYVLFLGALVQGLVWTVGGLGVARG